MRARSWAVEGDRAGRTKARLVLSEALPVVSMDPTHFRPMLPLGRAVWKQPFHAKRLLPAGLFRVR